MDLHLAGKRAIVTGGSRGIGLAVARRLADEGARLVLVSRDQVALDRAVEGIGGADVVATACDTSDDTGVAAMVAQAVRHFGGVDILVNAAAEPLGAGPDSSNLRDGLDEELRWQMEVKVLGYLRCARAVAPHMTAQGWGRIISVSGMAARQAVGVVGSVRNVAVAAMTKNLADELGPRGVNVTVVHPGLTVTERLPAMVAGIAAHRGVSEDEVVRDFGSLTTLGRLVTADEVADVVTFLASPRSVAINGDAVVASGGAPGAIYY